MVRSQVVVKGFVQGVGFRYFLKQTADALRLSGWVRNTPDGNVEAVFEGSEASVEKAIAACKEGPPFAKVEHVTEEEREARGDLEGFSIEYY